MFRILSECNSLYGWKVRSLMKWGMFSRLFFISTKIHHQLEEMTPLVTGVKSYMYTSPTGRNTPLVIDVKSYIYSSPTGRNYAVSYWRKILHVYITDWKKYAVSYWRKILHINTIDRKKLRR